MKTIKTCGRCGITEKPGKVFENVANFQLCIDCAQVAYKAKYALTDGNIKTAITMFGEFKEGIIEGSYKQVVLSWVEGFSLSVAEKQIADIEIMFADFLTKHKSFTDGELPKSKARLYLDLIGFINGTHPFEFTNIQVQEAQKNYNYIVIILDYWRS